MTDRKPKRKGMVGGDTLRENAAKALLEALKATRACSDEWQAQALSGEPSRPSLEGPEMATGIPRGVEDERRGDQAQVAPAPFNLGAYIDEHADFDD